MASPSAASPTMASPSPSPTTVIRRRSKTPSKNALNPSFSDLPSSLLEIIMAYLVLKDNIRASAACKSWCEAAVSVRVVEKHPWLMCFPKRGNLFEFRDPLGWKLYALDLPELAKSTVCYIRDGWLLMRRSTSNEIFFFNPFSQELIRLPKFEPSFLHIAFSCAPTSDNCVVVVLKFVVEHFVTVSTWHPGATEWITKDCPSVFDQYHSNLVYFNDRFCCFHIGLGCFYSFDPSSQTWDFLQTYIDHELHLQLQHEMNEKAVCLVEKNGELFLILPNCAKKPVLVYKLVSLRWREMTSTALDGLTIFVSFYNSELRRDLPWMRNSVYFSRFGYNRKRCVSYPFDEDKYNPLGEWLELCPPKSLWIDPPKNVGDYL